MLMYDNDFLKTLQNGQHRTIYGRIALLSKDERVLQQLEGTITGGSINIDGTSAVRRTCSLSMVSNNVNISSYLWSLENKFRLEIGLENSINPKYPKIIWFPQGIFIITGFSSSLSTNAYNININGKDKMCLLNGEVGGTFNSEIDFGKLEVKDKNNNIRLIKLPIKKIIREMVHQYGGEPFHNIVINDLDDKGLELLEYRLDKPLYIWRSIEDSMNNFQNGTLNSKTVYLEDGTSYDITQLPPSFQFDKLSQKLQDNELTKAYLELDDKGQPSQGVYIAKIQFGDAAGYRETELVYPGDLIAKSGETITSVLDKIKNMLSFYEYFYNIEGQFVFQKKAEFQQISETFEGSNLLTSINNTPDLKNARNDFTAWGTRRSVNGAELPIHMRVAVQKKPYKYTPITVTDEELKPYNEAYGLNTKGQGPCPPYTTDEYDYRELIYQMSLDYRKYNHLDDFELKVIEANKDIFPTGTTGYEQYYIDLEGFWRQLYNPKVVIELPEKKEQKQSIENEIAELKKDVEKNKDKIALKEEEVRKINFQISILEQFNIDGEQKYWNKDVINHPESLNFFFKLLDTDGDLNNYSNEAIGNRPKVSNNTAIKAISYREVPFIIFGKPPKNPKTGYRYFNVPGCENAFSISAQGKSAEYEIKYLLSEYTYCLESVNINAVPIYDLNPNILIYINDLETGINGKYTVSKYSLSFNYNATMSITAVKQIDTIY